MLSSSHYHKQMNHYKSLLDNTNTKIEHYSTYLRALKSYKGNLDSIVEQLTEAEAERTNGAYSGEEFKVDPDLLSGDSENLSALIGKIEAKIEEYTIARENYQVNYRNNLYLYNQALKHESWTNSEVY